jgi:hypothetical protein
MDETLCEAFFGQPSHPLQRRYEALRAVFLEHRPVPEVATQFGYTYGSLRNLMTQFRDQCRRGQPPPFSPHRHADARAARLPTQR